jgi:hypothetical protein
MLLPWTLAASIAFPQSQPNDEPSKIDRLLVSSNGHFQALIRKAKGQEEVHASMARWMVEVSERLEDGGTKELWTARYAYKGDALEYRLAEDGSVLAAVSREFRAAQPIVLLTRLGEELAKLDGSTLIDDHRSLPLEGERRTWLESNVEAISIRWVDALFGPEQRLVLNTLRGPLHLRIDTGEIVVPGQEQALIQVEPALLEETKPPSLVPYVESIEMPAAADASAGLAFEVRGNNPTPGHSLAGFLIGFDGDSRLLSLETRSRYYPQGRLAPQVLQPFAYQGRVTGLPVGKLHVRLATRGQPLEDRVVEVLPGGLLLRLRRQGGIAGFDDVLELYGHGLLRKRTRASADSRFDYVNASEIGAIRGMLDSLQSSASGPPERVADALSFRLQWWREGEWVESTWSEPGKPPAGPLIPRILGWL